MDAVSLPGFWLAGLLLPLLFVPFLLRGDAVAHRLAPWTMAPALVLAVTSPADAVLDLPWLLVGARFGLDATAQFFLLFTALLWLIAALYARAYVARDPHRNRFMALFLAAASGNLGLIVSQDVASFYLFFALMSFAAYGLVVHAGDDEARRAGRVYLVMAVIGEVLLFIGFLLGVDAAGSTALPQVRAAVAASPLRDFYVALILAGFGIKVAVLPLHMWLPLAYTAAPTPASAVLSGVIIKAGILGWIRFLPLGEVALAGTGLLLVASGVAAAFYGVAVGLSQDNPKTVLAYSSVSQMGFLTIGIGAGLAEPGAWPALLEAVSIYALHHALAKLALFLGVGVVRASPGRRAWRLWLMLGLTLPSLALAGLPWTSGALAKLLLQNAVERAALPASTWLPWALSAAALGTTALMGRLLFLLWRAAPAPQTHRGLALPWALSLIAVAVMAWDAPRGNVAALARTWLAPEALWSASWPVVAGATAALLAWHRAPAWLARTPAVPAGDILCWAMAALPVAQRWAGRVAQTSTQARAEAVAAAARWRAGTGHAARARAPAGGWRGALARWRVSGAALLVLLSLFFVLLATAGRGS